MRITKVIPGKNSKQTKINISTGGSVFIQTEKYISDGSVIIKSEYVNKIFFHSNIKNILSPLPTSYNIFSGSMRLGSPVNIDIAKQFEEMHQQQEKSSAVLNLGTRIRCSPYKTDSYEARLLFAKHLNRFIGINSKYAKILDGDFLITANHHTVFLRDTISENRVAIVMASYIDQEIEMLQDIFARVKT